MQIPSYEFSRPNPALKTTESTSIIKVAFTFIRLRGNLGGPENRLQAECEALSEFRMHCTTALPRSDLRDGMQARPRPPPSQL